MDIEAKKVDASYSPMPEGRGLTLLWAKNTAQSYIPIGPSGRELAAPARWGSFFYAPIAQPRSLKGTLRGENRSKAQKSLH